ncbi:MAG: MFS transporter [Streptococcaceae bacterium]|jgi:predicted MFS family arabinose efflux permease|nr:MFS transporter [Streptococcaceae bacterium]
MVKRKNMDRKKLLLALGIVSMNLVVMSSSVVSSGIAAIAKSFPKEPVSKVQMLSSLPQLGQIIATLLFTWLAYTLTRKHLGALAITIVAVGGLIPVFFNSSLNLILACMVVLGFGVGLVSSIGPVLVQEHFEGEERATVMGWQVGANTLGMVVLTAFGGFIGSSNWRNLFWVYLVAVLILIMFWFLVPNDVKEKIQENQENGKKDSFFSLFRGLNPYIYIVLIATLFSSVALQTFMANLSITLAAKGSGTAYVALVMAIGNIGGIVVALGLSFIRKITKSNTIACGFISFTLAFISVIFFGNVFMHILGNIFIAAGAVLVNATVPFVLSNIADHRKFPLIMAMNNLVSALIGVFIIPIFAILHISVGEPSLFAGMMICTVVALLLLISRFGKRVSQQFES